jgi:hypothetical protein
MTAELEELLAAAKAIDRQLHELRLLRIIRSDERSAGIRLNIAVRAFEEARAKIGASNPMPLIRVVMRGDEIPTSIYNGVEPLGDRNDVFKIEVYRVAKKPMPTAPAPYDPDPYDFGNDGLRKEP